MSSSSGNPMTTAAVAWWSLPVALAWVATKDLKFVENIAAGNTALDLAIELAQRKINSDIGDVWRELRNAAAQGRVQLRGQPFLNDGRTIGIDDRAGKISSTEVSQLRIHEHDEAMLLAPEGNQYPRWYRQVCISSDDLMREFPPSSAEPASRGRPKGPDENQTERIERKHANLQAALKRIPLAERKNLTRSQLARRLANDPVVVVAEPTIRRMLAGTYPAWKERDLKLDIDI